MFVRAVTRSCNALGAVRKCSTEKLEKTAFYDLHLSLGGKMVPFAGYSLPVQYEGLGVLKEHVHTRSADGASLFDVSHMGQIKWTGKDAVAFIEKMTVCDVKSLKVGEAKLSLVMNEKGTIMDDTVITNAGDHLYMVVNGACKVGNPHLVCIVLVSFLTPSVQCQQWKDMDHFKHYMKSTGMDVHMDYLGDQQLLAVQVRSD
jgi:aminomethyltransferase